MWDSLLLQPPPCCESSLPGCPSPLLLPVWISVSSLTSWLSDFHTVRFSGSSGCFLFLNLLLSFFWLCEEARCVYPCLHLVQKSLISFSKSSNSSCLVRLYPEQGPAGHQGPSTAEQTWGSQNTELEAKLVLVLYSG